MATRRPGKPHPMQGQAGPFAGCSPRSRSAASDGWLLTTESGLPVCYGKAPLRRGFSMARRRRSRPARGPAAEPGGVTLPFWAIISSADEHPIAARRAFGPPPRTRRPSRRNRGSGLTRVFRNAERPRVAALRALLMLVAAIAIGVGGVLAGKASVDDGAPSAAPNRAAAGAGAGAGADAGADATAAKRELRAVKAGLEAQIARLKKSEASSLSRAERAEKARAAWRARALRAERGVRARAAARRRSAARRGASRTRRRAPASPRPRAAPAPPPPPAAAVVPPPPPARPAPPPPPGPEFPF